MQIFNLPNDIFSEYKAGYENIIFHDYSAPVGSFKGKSILHKNAISLVISGEKTMHFAEKTVHIKDDEFHFLSEGNCLYDKPPAEWFLLQRMKLAKELLHHEKPSEVYYKVGYESHSSFSQAFRKIFGKTPREFQSKYLND